MTRFKFGMDSMERDYKIVKDTIQHPHLNTTIYKSTISGANAWVSARWDRNVDYRSILVHLGVKIIED